MNVKFKYIWNKLLSSFWFVPLVYIVASINLAYLMIQIDQMVTYEPEGFARFFFFGTADSAQIVLSTIAAAMIGVAGTVFSITLVALTLASSQLGPRLLRNFMHNTLNQSVLGIYVSTFIYCLLILRTVNASEAVQYVPNLSVGVAIFLALLNIILLIVFIHHISVSIQADRVIADISNSLSRNIQTYFPKKDSLHTIPMDEKTVENQLKLYSYEKSFSSSQSGYIQVVNIDKLMSIALKKDLVIHVKYKPGDFVVDNTTVIHLYSKKEIDANAGNELLNQIYISSTRTPSQDTEFAIHQMVEVACRALSPGINDPFTAVTCIDHLSAILCKMVQLDFPPKYLFDKDNNIRMIVFPETFKSLIDAAFNQIRQYGSEAPGVLIRLLEGLDLLLGCCSKQEDREEVMRHASMTKRLAETTFKEENDLNDLMVRYEKLLYNFRQKR